MTPFIYPLRGTPTSQFTTDEVAAFATRTGWVDDMAVIEPETTMVTRVDLPWWDGVELIIATDERWPGEGATAAWMLDEHLHRLDGTSPPIHRINAEYKPSFDEKNVLEYLGFFCWFVRGEEGPFAIVETENDAHFPMQAGAEKLDEVVDKLRPATLLERRDDGFHCEAPVWYADILFFSNFVVKLDGMIEMREDEPLVAETGVQIASTLKFERLAKTPDRDEMS